MFKKKYDNNEVKCPNCKKLVKPIIQNNKLKQNFYGQRFTGTEKKFLLVCPHCKGVISSQ
jgi:Zn finger protein HypA/HybF involved in hydrogenase expression